MDEAYQSHSLIIPEFLEAAGNCDGVRLLPMVKRMEELDPVEHHADVKAFASGSEHRWSAHTGLTR